jgi:hypothetical protein
MTGHGCKFPRKKEQAIAALVTHPSIEGAARAVGVSSKTLHRWLRIPEFQDAYRKARKDNFAQLSVQFEQACPLALATLLQLMRDSKAPASKVRAAVTTVKYATKAMAQEDLQARVRRLEQRQAEPPSSASLRPTLVETASRSPLRGHGAKLGHKKEEAIAALLKQPTIERAAGAAGVSSKTLQRWLRIPEFQEAYRKARWDKFSQLTAQFQYACSFALETLRKVLNDSGTPAASRISAAQFVVHTAQALAEEDLQVRVQRLEQQPQEQASWKNEDDVQEAA